jgi:hypothetical protein
MKAGRIGRGDALVELQKLPPVRFNSASLIRHIFKCWLTPGISNGRRTSVSELVINLTLRPTRLGAEALE